jgi:hypothetical protein
VRVTDSLNTGVAGRLSWAELARRIDGLAGAVAMTCGAQDPRIVGSDTYSVATAVRPLATVGMPQRIALAGIAASPSGDIRRLDRQPVVSSRTLSSRVHVHVHDVTS